MKKFKDQTLREYTQNLSQKAPVPGGGSAAALTACLGVSLILMTTRYSRKKDTPKRIESRFKAVAKESDRIRSRLLQLVDLDAQAYLKLTKTPKTATKRYQQAKKRAREVPLEICKLCYDAIQLTPFLVENGNRYLLCDLQSANEFLLAGYNAAKVMVEINS